LPNFICKAIDEVREKDSGFNTLLLAVGETTYRSLQDEILECLSRDVPTITMNFRDGIQNISMHKVSMVVMITNERKIVVGYKSC
jgi:hypothetical protein